MPNPEVVLPALAAGFLAVVAALVYKAFELDARVRELEDRHK